MDANIACLAVACILILAVLIGEDLGNHRDDTNTVEKSDPGTWFGGL